MGNLLIILLPKNKNRIFQNFIFTIYSLFYSQKTKIAFFKIAFLQFTHYFTPKKQKSHFSKLHFNNLLIILLPKNKNRIFQNCILTIYSLFYSQKTKIVFFKIVF